MTWTELQGELSDRGLVRADTGASTARVAGIAYDSRAVAPRNSAAAAASA